MDWIKIIDYIYANNEYTAAERHFLFSQIKTTLFNEFKESRDDIDLHLFKLYSKIADDFRCELNEEYHFIENRNENFVIILTTQFLKKEHAPTIAVLNIARYLSSHGKDILIVNSSESMGGLTPELLTKKIPFPMDSINVSNYISEYSSLNKYEYNGTSYPFFQFDNDMPNISGIKMFLNTVRKLKPGFIINIAGDSPLADACSNLVPTLCVSMGNRICFSYAQAQYIGRELLASDAQLLNILGLSTASIIAGNYIYDFQDDGKNIKRKDLNISDDVFLLAIVGNRLDSELDQEFLTTLNDIVSPQINAVFIGDYSKHETALAALDNLAANSHFLGYVLDLPAVLSICDLFVNPIRLGGGTSAVMAMKRGCPILTTNYGDIAIAAGPQFTVSSLEEYSKSIFRYYNDYKYYSSMSTLAKHRASELTDVDNKYTSLFAQFNKIIDNLSP